MISADRAARWLAAGILVAFPVAQLAGLTRELFYAPVLGVLVLSVYASRGRLPGAKLLAPLALWYVTLLWSAVWAFDRFETVSKLVTFALVLWFGYFGAVSTIKTKGRWLIRAVEPMVYVVVACLIAIVSLFGGAKFGGVQEDVGFFAPNAAAWLIVALPVVVQARRLGHLSRLRTASAVMAILIGAMLTGSRAAFLLVPISIAVLAVTNEGLRPRAVTRVAVGAFVLALVVAAAYVAVPAARTTVELTAGRLTGSQLVSGAVAGPVDPEAGADFARIAMVRLSLEHLQASPVVGLGFQSFRAAMIDRFGFGIRSHNLLVTAWVEGGLASLITFTVMVLILASRVVRARVRLGRSAGPDFLLVNLVLSVGVVVYLHWFLQPQEYNPFFAIVTASGLMISKVLDSTATASAAGHSDTFLKPS